MAAASATADVAAASATADVKQVWEAAVASDTPYWRDNLRALEDEASEMQRSVAHLLKVSQAYTAASEAQAEARRDMVEAVLSTANDAFQHANLAVRRARSSWERCATSLSRWVWPTTWSGSRCRAC